MSADTDTFSRVVPARQQGAPPASRALLTTAPAWQVRHTAAAAAGDVGAVVVSAAAYAVWGSASVPGVLAGGAVVLVVVVVALVLAGAWTPTGLGQGVAEYSRLMNGMAAALVVVGLAGLAMDLPEARPWAFGVIPLAALLAAGSRKVLRTRLHRARSTGAAMRSLLAVGSADSVTDLVLRTGSAGAEGFRITAACVPRGSVGGATQVAGVPIVGDVADAAALARAGGYDTVSVSHHPGWSSAALSRLAWQLDATTVDLVVDPGLMEVAGPRLHTASVDGLPLLQLSHPRFTGPARLIKAGLDRIGAALLLLALSPLMLGIAVAIRRDGGPAFFRQTRVGLDGREFRMVKFRSMVIDAEARLTELQHHNQGAGPLFKLHADPRVTRLGARLRRYSLDELPQLFNVVAGSMSLVGPRPPLPSEVARYEQDAQRKLMVRPGMTGLWQVSGRSDLSWEESVRLDLRYVENWTFALDLQILARTIRAVRGKGAY